MKKLHKILNCFIERKFSFAKVKFIKSPFYFVYFSHYSRKGPQLKRVCKAETLLGCVPPASDAMRYYRRNASPCYATSDSATINTSIMTIMKYRHIIYPLNADYGNFSLSCSIIQIFL